MIKEYVMAGLMLAFAATNVYAAEPMIQSSKAAFYVGSQVMVCGNLSEVKRFSKGLYLNLGAKYPSQHISILVWNNDEAAFVARFGALATLQGKQACARGLIESYRNTLQLKVSNPQFLRLME